MTNNTTTTLETPAFMRMLANKWRAGVAHGFILWGNTTDDVFPTVNLRNFLANQFGERIVVNYRRDTGLTCATPGMETKLRDILKYDERKQQNPEQAAMMAAITGTMGMPTNLPGQAPALPRTLAEALPEIDMLLHLPPVYQDSSKRNDNRCIVIIENAETIVPDMPYGSMPENIANTLVTLSNWGMDPVIETNQHIVILVTPVLADLHSAIRSASNKWESIEIKLPTPAQRLDYINMLCDDVYKDEWDIDWQIDRQQLARVTGALARIHILDILLRAADEGKLTSEIVSDNKQRIIKAEYADVITIYDPNPNLTFAAVGGKKKLKEFFKRFVITPLRTGNSRGCPKGVILMGPPGTGKSLFMKALAGEAGVPLIIFNLAKILGMYVGNSERNLEKAIMAMMSLGGIVFIDELDQAMSRSSGGDTGVSSRVFGRFMDWMADDALKGQIVFVAATNRPDLIDDALMRPGRFGDKKAADLPGDALERAEILQIHARKQQLPITGISALTCQQTEGWTGADLAGAIDLAVELSEFDGYTPDDAVEEATRRITPPLSRYMKMIQLAVSMTNDKSYIPEQYQYLLGAPAKNEPEPEQAQEPQAKGKRSRRDLDL